MLEQKNEAIQNLEDVRTKYEEERKSFQNQQLESDRQLINFKLKVGCYADISIVCVHCKLIQ